MKQVNWATPEQLIAAEELEYELVSLNDNNSTWVKVIERLKLETTEGND